MSLQVKSMDSSVRLDANRSHSRSYGEDLQRRMADEDAISCKRFGETQYQEPVGLGDRLRNGISDPFLASPLSENTGFLSHSWAMGLQIRQKLSSLGPLLAIDAPRPTGS